MNLYTMMILLMSISSIMCSMICMYKTIFISIEIPFLSINLMNMNISIILDWMSTMFLSTVLFISSMIMMFSKSYMPLKEQKQFLLLMMMFIMSMIMLILSDNIIFIMLGWDGLGFSSYILVVYYKNAASAASGTITIMSNRLGDIMIIMSISMLIMNWELILNKNMPMLVMIMLLMAACSKSAQFPFSAWLPAAMAAPTPISALVHSSTLVTAGVYLLIRTMNYMHPMSMMIMLLISSMTTIYASMSAMWEQDMKKIIALSTLSQIGIMMFAISLGSSSIAFFHLIIHALFKSMMFLCSGIMIHDSSYQDMRHMGSMMMNSPLTSSILGISSLALMGTPFMSGFFSKDSIIEFMLINNFTNMISMIMMSSIFMTALYSIRMMKLSTNLYLKNKKDMLYISSINMENPIMMMSILTIIMGPMMLWFMSPEQLFLIPNPIKMTITFMVISGTMMALSMKFSNNMYIMLGNSSTSMWYIHLLSTMMSNKMNNLMNNFFKNDNSWMESYGPKSIYSTNIYLSKMSYSMFMMMFIILMMFMIPMIM